VLIIGNEVLGLDKKIINACDVLIEIPMHGKKESLNVSVATGIALYGILGV
jgi:tRNA G18 (ribose-2'-O)-methylase SpoU